MNVPRRRPPWLVCAVATVAVLAGLVVGVPPAAAAPVEVCSLDLSTGAYSCSTDAAATRPTVEAASTTLLARMYDAPNRSVADGYLDIFAAGPCDTAPDVDWQVGVMPTGWNDRISSFQGFSECDVRLWQNGGFSGASYGPATSANSLGAMDNQTSSLTFA
jgi:hypothetical protein